MNGRNGYPIPVRRVNPDGTGEPSVKALIASLKGVYAHQDRAAEVGRVARDSVVNRFHPTVVADAVLARIAQSFDWTQSETRQRLLASRHAGRSVTR